ncbi:MAG: hypothetical protein GY696_12505 [Gammaproteobacteria bacterium]|nr:hypothetical protein [Gammaproteobacteria bacterium]
MQTALGYAHWTPPEPARVQNQWGAQAPARAQNQWGPGRIYAVQTMPAAPLVCHTCGQSGHFKRECPNGGAYSGRGGARPAGRGRGMDRSRMTCYKCLSRGHTVHECTVSDQQVEAMRQKNLEGILATRGALAVSTVSEEHYGPSAGNFMAGITDMQAAFESLNHAGSDFQ